MPSVILHVKHYVIITYSLNKLWSFNMYDPYFDSFGLPLTVLCQTTGKLVLLAKFWVTAIWGRLLMICVRCNLSDRKIEIKSSDYLRNLNTVVSMFRTTCHIPPGTKIVSPGCWIHSTGAYLAFIFLPRSRITRGSTYVVLSSDKLFLLLNALNKISHTLHFHYTVYNT